jgi:hypothetical protein
MAPKRSESLKKYLNNQSDVVNARDAEFANLNELRSAEFFFNNLSPTNKDFPAAFLAYQTAKAKQDALEEKRSSVEAAATKIFEEEEASKTRAKSAKEVFAIEGQLNSALKEKNAYIKQGAPVPNYLETSIKNFEAQIREKGGRPTPNIPADLDDPADPVGDAGDTGDTGTTESALAVDIVTFIQGYSGNVAKTKELQQVLKDANLYTGAIDGIMRPDIIIKSLGIADEKIAQYESTFGPFKDRMEGLKRLANDFKTGGGLDSGTGGVTVNVSDRTEAAGYVRSVFKSILQRDPTSAEISKYSKILQAAEKKNPTKTVNGVTTGGLGNPLEFLTVEIQKLPEFAKKKTDKVALTTQSILGTARANGITLNQNQIDSFAKRVQDGTDIKTIDSEIRNIATVGMPDKVVKLLNQGIDLDTIYSPYRNLMASVLELNPESIDLKDATLRSAIGSDREMTIYDFEKALRKDYRWQYTDNAKRDVSNVALKVLRDFGFQA